MTERRDQIVRELETWYFGCSFSEWTKPTEVGEWRDIVNEACGRIAVLEADKQGLRGSLERCISALGKFDQTDYDGYGGPHLSEGITKLGAKVERLNESIAAALRVIGLSEDPDAWHELADALKEARDA